MLIKNRRLTLSCWAIAFATFASATALAQVWNKKTVLTVHERMEVPGAVLEPGKYVLKLVDSESNRHIVRFINERENRVISTVIAVPNYRLQPTGDTEFAWYERPAGEPPALRAWFYPGDNFGQEFVYPKRRAVALAAAAHVPVPAAADAEEPRMRAAVEPEAPVARELKEAEVFPEEPPTVMARAREPERASTPEPSPAPTPAEPRPTLPATAGLWALFGLIGAGALGAAAGLGAVLRRG